MLKEALARLTAGLIDWAGLGELINYLLNRRLIARRSVVDLKGVRQDVDTYEFTETKTVRRGVLCFRQTVLSTYEETNGRRKLISQSVLAEQQVECPPD